MHWTPLTFYIVTYRFGSAALKKVWNECTSILNFVESLLFTFLSRYHFINLSRVLVLVNKAVPSHIKCHVLHKCLSEKDPSPHPTPPIIQKCCIPYIITLPRH